MKSLENLARIAKNNDVKETKCNSVTRKKQSAHFPDSIIANTNQVIF